MAVEPRGVFRGYGDMDVDIGYNTTLPAAFPGDSAAPPQTDTSWLRGDVGYLPGTMLFGDADNGLLSPAVTNDEGFGRLDGVSSSTEAGPTDFVLSAPLWTAILGDGGTSDQTRQWTQTCGLASPPVELTAVGHVEAPPRLLYTPVPFPTGHRSSVESTHAGQIHATGAGDTRRTQTGLGTPAEWEAAVEIAGPVAAASTTSSLPVVTSGRKGGRAPKGPDDVYKPRKSRAQKPKPAAAGGGRQAGCGAGLSWSRREGASMASARFRVRERQAREKLMALVGAFSDRRDFLSAQLASLEGEARALREELALHARKGCIFAQK